LQNDVYKYQLLCHENLQKEENWQEMALSDVYVKHENGKTYTELGSINHINSNYYNNPYYNHDIIDYEQNSNSQPYACPTNINEAAQMLLAFNGQQFNTFGSALASDCEEISRIAQNTANLNIELAHTATNVSNLETKRENNKKKKPKKTKTKAKAIAPLLGLELFDINNIENEEKTNNEDSVLNNNIENIENNDELYQKKEEVYESTPIKEKLKPTHEDIIEDIDNVLDLIDPIGDIEGNLFMKDLRKDTAVNIQTNQQLIGQLNHKNRARLLPDGFAIWKDKYRCLVFEEYPDAGEVEIESRLRDIWGKIPSEHREKYYGKANEIAKKYKSEVKRKKSCHNVINKKINIARFELIGDGTKLNEPLKPTAIKVVPTLENFFEAEEDIEDEEIILPYDYTQYMKESTTFDSPDRWMKRRLNSKKEFEKDITNTLSESETATGYLQDLMIMSQNEECVNNELYDFEFTGELATDNGGLDFSKLQSFLIGDESCFDDELVADNIQENITQNLECCKKLVEQENLDGCRELVDHENLGGRRDLVEKENLSAYRELFEQENLGGCRELVDLENLGGLSELVEQENLDGCRELAEQKNLGNGMELVEEENLGSCRELIKQENLEGCRKLVEQENLEGCRKLVEQENLEGCRELVEQKELILETKQMDISEFASKEDVINSVIYQTAAESCTLTDFPRTIIRKELKIMDEKQYHTTDLIETTIGTIKETFTEIKQLRNNLGPNNESCGSGNDVLAETKETKKTMRFENSAGTNDKKEYNQCNPETAVKENVTEICFLHQKDFHQQISPTHPINSPQKLSPTRPINSPQQISPNLQVDSHNQSLHKQKKPFKHLAGNQIVLNEDKNDSLSTDKKLYFEDSYNRKYNRTLETHPILQQEILKISKECSIDTKLVTTEQDKHLVTTTPCAKDNNVNRTVKITTRLTRQKLKLSKVQNLDANKTIVAVTKRVKKRRRGDC